MERAKKSFVKDECYYEKCRLCTFPSGNTCTDIYTEKEPRRLIEQIKICTGIEVSKDDGLPQRLCSRCYIMLRLFYPFVLEARQAQFTLTYWEYISQNLPLPEGVEYPKGYKGYEDECNHHCKKIDDNFRINKNDDGNVTLPSKSVATESEIVTKADLSSERSESKSKRENEVEDAILSSSKKDLSNSKKCKPKLRASRVTKRTVRIKMHKKWKPGKLMLTKYRNTTLFKESNSSIQPSAGDMSVERTCKLYGGTVQSKHNDTPLYQPSCSSSTQLQDFSKSQLTENNLEVTSSSVELNDSFLKSKEISHQEEKHSETYTGNAIQCGQIISSKLSLNGPSPLTDTDMPRERNSNVNSSEKHKTVDTSSASVRCVSEIKEINNTEDKNSDKHLDIICTGTDENVVQKSAHSSTSEMILPFKSVANDFEKSKEQGESSDKHDKKFTAVDERHLHSVSRVTEDGYKENRGNTCNDQADGTSESFSFSGSNSKDDTKPTVEEVPNSKSVFKCSISTQDADKQDECDMNASCHLSIEHPVISEIVCIDKPSTVIDEEQSSRSRHEHLMEHQAGKEEIRSKYNMMSQKSKVVKMEISCKPGDNDLIESSVNDDEPISTEKTNGKVLPEPLVIDLEDDSFSPEDAIVKHVIFKPGIKDNESTVLSSINSDFNVKVSSNTETWMDEVMEGNSSKSFPKEDTASIKTNICSTFVSLPDKNNEVHQSVSINISQKENGDINNTVISTKLSKTLSVNISQENGEVKNTVISTKLISEDSLGSSINQTNSETKTSILCEENPCFKRISRGTAAEQDLKDQLTGRGPVNEHVVKETSSGTKSCPKVVVSSPPGTRRLRQRKIPERYRSDSFLNSDVALVIATETRSRMKNKLDKQNDSRVLRSVKKGKVVKSPGVKIRKKVKLFSKDKCDIVLDAFCMENKPQEEMKATIQLSSELPQKTRITDKENVYTNDHDDKASKDQHLIKPVVVDLVNDIEAEVHNNTGNLISKIEKNIISTAHSLILPTDKEVEMLSDGDISFVQLGTSTDCPIAVMNESVIASVDNKETTHSGNNCQAKDNKAESRSTDIKESENKNSCQKLLSKDECHEKDDNTESRSTDIKESENDNSCQKLLSKDECHKKDDNTESRSTDIKESENENSCQKLLSEDVCHKNDGKTERRSTDIKESENENSCQKLLSEDVCHKKDGKTESRSTDIKGSENEDSCQKLLSEEMCHGKEDKTESNSTDIKANENDISGQKLHPKDKCQKKDNKAESRSTDIKEDENETSCHKLSLSPTVSATACNPPATIFVSPSSFKGKNKPKGKKKSVSFDFPEESFKSNDKEPGSSITSDSKHPASRRNILNSSDCDASFLKLSPDKLNKSNILEEPDSSCDMQKAVDNNSVILPIDGGRLSRASRICRLVMSPCISLTKSPVSSGALQDKSNATCDEAMSKEQHSSPSRKLDVSPSISESSSPSSAKHDGTYKTSPQTEGRLSRTTRILQLVTSPVQEPQNKVSAECTNDDSLNEDSGQDKSTNKEDRLVKTEELLTKSETSESNKCTKIVNSDNLLAMNEVDVNSSSGVNSSSSLTLQKVNEVSKQGSPVQSIISTGKNKERSKRKSVRFNIPEVMPKLSGEISGDSLSVCENDESSDIQNFEGEAEVQNERKSVLNSDSTADSELNGTHTEEESSNTCEMLKLPTIASEGSYSRASRICNLVISPLSRKNIETSFTKREAESPKNMDASSVRRERDNSPLQKLSPITANSRITRASRIFNLVCPNKDDSKTGLIKASPKLDPRISAVQLPLKIPPSNDVSNEITKCIDDQTRLSVLTCKIMDSEMMRTPPVARRSLKRKLLDESNLTPDKEAKICVRSPHPDMMLTSSSGADEVNEATREIDDLAGGQLLLGKVHTLTCPVTSEVSDKSSQETMGSDSIIMNSECEERVSGNESVHLHMNGHLNEDQLSCENCSATFTREEELKMHVNLVHVKSSESLPWILKCELCSNSFHSKPRLLLHMKRFHGKDIKPSNKTVK